MVSTAVSEWSISIFVGERFVSSSRRKSFEWLIYHSYRILIPGRARIRSVWMGLIAARWVGRHPGECADPWPRHQGGAWWFLIREKFRWQRNVFAERQVWVGWPSGAPCPVLCVVRCDRIRARVKLTNYQSGAAVAAAAAVQPRSPARASCRRRRHRHQRQQQQQQLSSARSAADTILWASSCPKRALRGDERHHPSRRRVVQAVAGSSRCCDRIMRDDDPVMRVHVDPAASTDKKNRSVAASQAF